MGLLNGSTGAMPPPFRSLLSHPCPLGAPKDTLTTSPPQLAPFAEHVDNALQILMRIQIIIVEVSVPHLFIGANVHAYALSTHQRRVLPSARR